MGCDIHFYVEKFKLTGPDEKLGPSMDHLNRPGTWVTADKWEPNEYYKPDDPDYAGEPPLRVDYDSRFYTGRNYDLFAILADVRNGSGFAGCDTGDGFVPIDEPRGLPVDVSPEVKADSDRWDCDGHSHSWFGLKELLSYNWLQTTKQRGVMHAHSYLQWSWYDRFRGKGPDTYSGGIWGPGIVTHPSMADMDQFLINAWLETASDEGKAKLAEIPEDDGWNRLRLISRNEVFEERVKKELHNHIVQAEWEESYVSAVQHFWVGTLPKLLQLAMENGQFCPEHVRIVFWFDN